MSAEIALAEQHDAAGRHDEAINALARATQQGDVEATTRLGKRLVAGDRAPYLPVEGARFLADANNRGGAEAAARLAVLVAAGAHVPQNWGAAFELLVVAAERGWGPAQEQSPCSRRTPRSSSIALDRTERHGGASARPSISSPGLLPRSAKRCTPCPARAQVPRNPCSARLRLARRAITRPARAREGV